MSWSRGGRGPYPSPALCSLPGPPVEAQSHFGCPQGTSAFFHVSCFFSFLTGLTPKACVQAEPRDYAKVTGPSFHWVLLGR